MKHLIGIDYIQHLSCEHKILWEQKNILNMLHNDGEEFVLRSIFLGGKTNNAYIPNYYYFGLDNRVSLAASDIMTSLVSEPTTSGYTRVAVASTSNFTLGTNETNTQISSPIVTFRAVGGSWGPVKNLFLTDASDNTGYLISSVALASSVTLNDGESINLRMSITLKDCP